MDRNRESSISLEEAVVMTPNFDKLAEQISKILGVLDSLDAE
jgi:hypothetical protein